MLAAHRSPLFEQTDLFAAGEGGYDLYRTPTLVTTASGTVIAICEGRRQGADGESVRELVCRRSKDNGRCWGPPVSIDSRWQIYRGHPCPVVDLHTGTICLLTCGSPADASKSVIMSGLAARTVWVASSDDDGQTWSTPREITAQVKLPHWTWYGTGPGHGIQLDDGRLIIPCNHTVGQHFDQRDPAGAHVIISDDHGQSWRLGGVVATVGTTQSAVVQTEDASGVYLNCRFEHDCHRRVFARSSDRAESFTSAGVDPALVDPVCQGSLLRLPPTGGRRGVIVFANPASTRLEHLSVRVSADDGSFWTPARSLTRGPSAYSDLASAPDGTVMCLYESGRRSPYERLTLARFNRAWLEV